MMVTSRIRRQPVPMQVRDGPRADGAGAIVVGYGRFGQTVAQMLMAGGVSVTTIDVDIEMIDTASSFGAKVYFGDGTRLDLLRQAGAADAQLIMFCQDGDARHGRFCSTRFSAQPSRRRRSMCAPSIAARSSSCAEARRHSSCANSWNRRIVLGSGRAGWSRPRPR